MDETRFDRIARLLAEGRGRRDIFRLLAGAGAALGVSPALARQDGADGADEATPDDAAADDPASEIPDADRAADAAPGTEARCGQKRDSCRRDSQCCSGLACVNDRCTRDRDSSCTKRGKRCTSSRECCSGLTCSGGACERDSGGSCSDEGRACSRNRDCCDDLICNDDGRCGTKSPVRFERKWGTLGTGNSQFNQPEGVAIDAGTSGGDLVYVADTRNDRVQKFTASGSYQSQWGSQGSTPRQFRSPAGIGVNENNGYIYVADRDNNRLSVFNASASPVEQVGASGSGTQQFSLPSDVAVLRGNETTVKAFVADTGNDRIQLLRQDPLRFIDRFGQTGSGNKQFRSPRGVAVSSSFIVVADSQNNRIQVFDNDSVFTFVRAFGTSGSQDGQLRNPRGVALDDRNRIWVADTDNNRIQVFSINGDFQFKIGGTSASTADGKFDAPRGIAVVGTLRDGYRIYVADTFNNRIQKFTIPGRR